MSDEDSYSFCSVNDPCTSADLSKSGVQLFISITEAMEVRGLALIGVLPAKVEERGEEGAMV
jgi:hypothetical protein